MLRSRSAFALGGICCLFVCVLILRVSRPGTNSILWLCQIKANLASNSYDQGVLSGLLENPSFREQFGDPDDVITGITVASYCLGALFGCLISFAVGDMLGRRYMIWLAMGLIIVGASLQTSAHTLHTSSWGGSSQGSAQESTRRQSLCIRVSFRSASGVDVWCPGRSCSSVSVLSS